MQPVISNRDIQKVLNSKGLAYPSGHCPQVKLSGYLLGGGMAWNQVQNFMPGFEIAKKFMRGKVRSMSGLTAKVLGTPDRAWLEGKTP